MGQKQDNLIVVLDIGGAWTRVLAADINEEVLRYRGHGVVESAGMRKGLIAELAPAAKSVRKASEQAERAARAYIDKCVVGVGGPNVLGLNSSGGVQLGRGMREITPEDVRAVIHHARSIDLPGDREIVHLLPRQFILDKQPAIFDPVGMVGTRLEVELHIATCSGSTLQSAVTCANRAGLEVTEAVFESVAAAECMLSTDERMLGVCLLDIGAHSSDLAVFSEGAVAYTASVPIGGAHFTNDLAIGLQLPVAQAEELKKHYGHAVVVDVPQDAQIEIPAPKGGRATLPLRTIAEILEPRACELLQFVRESLRQGGVLDALGAGCVLSGGGAMLPGMLDVTESQLHVPARAGLPVRLSNMPAELNHPGWAVGIGMVLYAHRTRTMRAAEDNRSLGAKLRAMFAASF
jgi:cell division protein FtsA